jgi:hypothetical protein
MAAFDGVLPTAWYTAALYLLLGWVLNRGNQELRVGAGLVTDGDVKVGAPAVAISHEGSRCEPD